MSRARLQGMPVPRRLAQWLACSMYLRLHWIRGVMGAGCAGLTLLCLCLCCSSLYSALVSVSEELRHVRCASILSSLSDAQALVLVAEGLDPLLFRSCPSCKVFVSIVSTPPKLRIVKPDK